MQPPALNLIPTIQQAITSLLTVYEPEFLRFGTTMFMSFAAIVICWQGIRMMFGRGGLGDGMFDFAKLLLFVSFGYAMIAYYEAPLPGIGVSFSNLITDQTGYFQSVLEARAFDNIYRHFDTLGEFVVTQITFINQALIGCCHFNRVQFFALNVLHQRHFEHFLVIRNADISRNFGQICQF